MMHLFEISKIIQTNLRIMNTWITLRYCAGERDNVF